MLRGSISVVIPSHNAAAFLPESVASAFRQTRPPLEVLVVDDCSADDSVAVATACGARVIRQPANGGPGSARNAGMAAAVGEYVAFLDADDYWEPDHLATAAGLLDAHPAAALASSRVRYLPAALGDSAARAEPETPIRALVPLFRANLVVQTTAVGRRSALLAAGGYDPALRYAEDYDLWLRLARTAPIVLSHAITARYRVHPHQATQDETRLVAGGWEARRRNFAWLRRHGDPATVAAAADAVRHALNDELRWAWNAADRASMNVMLAADAWVPGATPIVRRWRGRLGPAEPLWRALKSVRSAGGRLRRRSVRGQ